jgi:acyl-coenzyme A thioesterase PaaI-like protein
MTPIDAEWLEAVRSEYGHCFGCGPDNPSGLHISGFSREGDTVSAVFQPRPDFRGFHHVLHGGILATALDEILAWTSILVADTMAVTAKLDLKFRRPAPPDSDYLLTGRLDERRGRRLMISGAAVCDGAVVAEASGLFVTSEPI